MELFSVEFFTALFSIIVIDLVLAGDNAIVIGMAARNLPRENQRQVIILGTAGAIVIRVAATLLVVQLLKIPYLLLAGGLLLIWIAYKLLTDEKKVDVAPASSKIQAVRNIIIADAVMGLDNVLAVAGAAQGSFLLVVLGLLISVPIIVWGSTLVIRLIERFPVIIYFGAGVLAFTAGKMIFGDPLISPLAESYPWLKWSLTAVIIAGVLLAGKRKKQTVAEPH
ncbi:TerC family protein [Desulfofalx alkaliphila]|uniref:TerC family protein n=1 Tax=Desulfofalx alkaliphila TaxID=105483 RepID=UPI0004E28720|nr:TerC family protein [Desulfofalx alkaliphila]